MSEKQTLIQAAQEKILLCDGAMGTQLQLAGMKPGECGELWNVERPEAVLEIQQRYANAGSDCIITNSFGASVCGLEKHGLGGRAFELNKAAAELARRALGERGWVLGDVGPFGDFLQPFGMATPDDLREWLRPQIQGLLAGGADAIMMETQAAIEEAAVGVELARELGAPCVIVSFAYNKAGGQYRTMMGVSPADVVAGLDALGVDIYGSNCGTELNILDHAQIAAQYRAATSKLVMAQPNAGSPQMQGGKLVYLETPDKMASHVADLAAAGANIIGGCCGTTPQHIGLFRQQIDQM